MKLLIVTQAIDKNNPILGFFVGWIEEFSKHCEKLTVICLEKGEYNLPGVKALSLGKENCSYNSWHSHIICRFVFLYRFYKYIFKFRNDYDAVFIHMNQEYVILGWFVWKFLAKIFHSEYSPVPHSGIRGKKIMMWRNHPMGNLFTDIAVWVSDRVFCTSKYAYTAKFKKTEIMPVGIDTELFKRKPEIGKIPNSILFLGRISPIKKPDLLIEALNLLNKEGVDFNALIVGDPLPKDKKYYEDIQNKVKKYGLEEKVVFMGAIKNSEAIDLYNKYEIFVNLTPSGSMDKTIFEAMACGSLVIVSNKSLIGKIDINFISVEGNFNDLAIKLKNILDLSLKEKEVLGKGLKEYILKEHGLELLVDKINKI